MEQNKNSLAEILLKSSSIIFLLIFIMRIFGYLFNSLLTKTITQSEYGSYTFAWSIAMLIVGVTLLGIDPAVGRYVAYYRGKEDANGLNSVKMTGFIIILFLTIFSLVFILGINRLFPQLLSLDKTLLIFMLVVLATHGIGFFFMSVISGYMKPEIGTIFSTIFAVLSFFFVLLTSYFGHDFTYVLFSILAAFLISNIGAALYTVKYLGIRGKFDFALSKELIIFGIPLVFIDLANNLLSWANIYVLKLFGSFVEVGVFYVATITSNVILLFSQPVVSIFAPVVAEMYGKKDFGKLAFLSSYLFERVLLLSSPILIVLLVFPEGILKIIFTGDYASGAIPLQILSLSVLFLGISMIFRTVITASGKPQLEARIIFIAAIINVVLNVLLVKPYGLLGASIASLVSSFLILVFSFKYARFITKIIAYRDRLLKIGVSLFISLVFVYAIKLAVLNLYMAFALSIVVLIISYLISLLALRTFRAEDEIILKIIFEKLPLLNRFENLIYGILKRGTS